MDAPIYRPAVAFEQPVMVPRRELRVEAMSLAELMSAPAVWAVVLKHAPMFKMTVRTPMIQPHLNNMTVETFLNLGLVSREGIEAIDQDLQQLPRSEWPTL